MTHSVCVHWSDRRGAARGGEEEGSPLRAPRASRHTLLPIAYTTGYTYLPDGILHERRCITYATVYVVIYDGTYMYTYDGEDVQDSP